MLFVKIEVIRTLRKGTSRFDGFAAAQGTRRSGRKICATTR